MVCRFKKNKTHTPFRLLLMKLASSMLVALVGLFLCAALVAANIDHGVALSVRVPAHKDECFYEDVPSAGTKVFFHFSVTNGGALDIDAAVYGPDGSMIWSSEKEQETRLLFKARLAGTHKFCFSNKMSSVTTKTVALTVQVGDPADGDKSHKVDNVERALIHVQEGLTEVRNEQNYLRTREREHRDTTESTNTRVLFWSIAEIGLLILLGVAQLQHLKGCFEKRRNV